MRGLRTFTSQTANRLTSVLLAGFVFLLPVQNALAVANLTLTTTFTSADSARANAYMDRAGTWNGTTEVTNSTTLGDRFVLRVENSGVGVTDAFDVDLTLLLPSGFRLPNTGSTPLTVTSPNACNTTTGDTDFTPLNASQSGSTVDFNIPNNRNIPAGCIYEFSFGVTTRDVSPFAAAGVNNFTYNLGYDDGGPGLLVSTVQAVQVNAALLGVTKTALTLVATNGSTVDFRIDLRNTGSGGSFAALLRDTLGANFTGITFVSVNAFNNTTNAVVTTPPYVGSPTVATNELRFNYIPPNVRLEVVVRTTATINPIATTCPVMVNQAAVFPRDSGSTSSNFVTVEYNLPDSLQLTHDLISSYCELCGVGTVQLTATNAGGIALVNVSIMEDLSAGATESGLTYVPGSTQISVDGGAPVAAGDPIVSGTNNEILTWTSAEISELTQLDSPFAVAPPNPISIEFIFQVRRNTAQGFTEQGLVTALRSIEASSSYDLICGGPTQTTASTLDELPIRQPIPVTTKLGRNADAGQDVGNYAPVIYGHVDDDIIWRVDVQNTGLAGMQDLQLDDTITGNFDINHICNSEAAASAAAAGTPPGVTCVSAGGGVRTSVLNFNADDPFGEPTNDEPTTFIDAPAAGDGFLYYVGRIRSFCSNQTNTANIEWGCEANPPDGGITVPASTGGITPANTITSTADMSTNVVAAGLDVNVLLTGSNQAQPLGSKGIVTITIANNTGGTVRLWNGADPNVGVDVDPVTDDNNDTAAATVSFTNILPTQYVMDRTFVPTAVMATAYGPVYNGMVDRIVHTNPITTPLANTAPRFRLYSSTTDVDPLSAATYQHLIRNGDVLTIQLGVVLIQSSRYDVVADLDVAPEVDPPTDPDNTFTVNNQFTLNALSYCSANPAVTVNANYPANPEDLDVDTSDALYILTNDPGTPLPLTTLVTNNGGHDADDYAVYITFGQAMTVQTAAAGCAATTNPPPHPVWNQPAFIPATAAVYRCYRGVIAPGATETFTFNVIKSANPAADDDLTFRADVVGEITLSDGALLTFPTPVSLASTTPNQQLANNYTLDGVRSRVLGFNLTKARVGNCTENNPPSIVPDLQVQIAEDCGYHIESGGWFGFLTPGFTLIAVENVVVTDDLPNGQGYIAHSFNNTSNITTPIVVNGGAGSVALDEQDIDWGFNTTGTGITIKDEWFRADVTTRMLNDPVDASAAPNVHAATSTNIARTNFDAIFNSVSGNLTIPVSDAAAIPGYPVEAIRRVDLTVTEPSITLVKAVCNETLYGVGTACSNFRIQPQVANDGDTQDSYIYRVQITNAAGTVLIPRAPAYDVTAIDTLDAFDQMFIIAFATDGLDNDGDGLIDGADVSESTISDNVLENATPAVITAAYTHSSALLRINPGATVTFYYRVNPADTIAPQQTLTNTVYATYDSLDGDHGNQNPPQLNNAEATLISGRARLYTSPSTSVSVQIIPLQTQPKAVIQVSNSAYTGSPQNVVVGEEVEYQLHAQIPVAHLRNFVIRDELPPGIRCVEAQTINLNAAPYSDAGFVPGGTFAATCTSTGINDVVQWSFGNQQLTTATSNNLFDFEANFIARVENSVTTQAACNVRNGGSTGTGAVAAPVACSTNPTLARLTYTDVSSTTVTLNYAAADLVVREPVVTVTKSFAPVVNADADNILTVTVTATNNAGAVASAYNLQILDNLTGTNMTYVPGSVGGATPPDNVDLTLGGNVISPAGDNQPIFEWNNPASAGYVLDPAETITFTFQVQVDSIVQPHEILDNTIQARWTSLPFVSTALPDIDTGAARSLAADGNPLGMRNGQLTGSVVVAPVSANPPNDYNTTATASVVVPQLTITKTDLNAAATTATIGEHKQFRIVIALPEGISNGVTVTDNLDALVAAGETYVLENDGTYDITYTFQNIALINGAAPDESVFNAFPADETSNTATWNIGTVDTTSENDSATTAINPQIIITYYARLNNDLVTNVGDSLQNNATLNYTNGQTAATEVRTDNTAAITVVEPLLVVSKVWSNVTPLKALGDAPDAGDILEYDITIDNTGNAAAFDINIRDTLPATVVPAAATPTATINGVPVVGFAAAPTISGAVLIWGRGNSDSTLDVPVSGQLVLTFRVVVLDTVETNQTIINTVVVDWTSLDGAGVGIDGLERTGAGNAACPDATGNVQPYNDYCAGPVTATATVPDANAVTKVNTADSYAPNDSNLRIGDTAQYSITLNLQEGTTRNISLVDTLPNGMEFVSVDVVNGDLVAPYDDNSAPIPFIYNDIAAPVVASVPLGVNTVTWAIGDVINAADNNAANDTFVIVYTAQVVNDELAPTQEVAPASASTTLTNTAVLNFDDVAAVNVQDTTTENIFAQQPIISLANISKVRRSGIPSGSQVSSGDFMDFRLTACNTGGAPAYDVVIDDDMEAPLEPLTIFGPTTGSIVLPTPPDVYVNGVLQPTDDSVYTYTQVGMNMHFVFDNIEVNPVSSAPNNCIVIEYNIEVTPPAINLSWDNTYTVTEYHSLLVGDANVAERETYGPVGPVIFNMNTFTASTFSLAKSLQNPLAPAEATIGQLVTYQIRMPGADLPIRHYDVDITDDLHDSLEFVSATLDTAASNCDDAPGTDVCAITSSGVGTNLVAIHIEYLEADEHATINVVARVANNVTAQNSLAAFNNSASYTFAATNNGSVILGATGTTATPLSIVEPQVTLQSKAVVNITNPGNLPDAGDILRYTLTMTAANAATFSDAFDISVIDTMSVGLDYSGNPTVAGSATYNATNIIAAPTLVSGDGITTSRIYRWNLAGGSNLDLAENETLTITYDVVVRNEILANQTLTNSAVIQWSSINGADINERDGSGGLNDYFDGPEVATIVTSNTNTISKSKVIDTYNGADDIVRVGDVIIYRLDLNLQEGTHNNLIVNDVLPQGVIFQSILAINGDGDSAAPGYSASAPFSYAAIPAGNITITGDPATGPTTLSMNLGNVVNAGNNLPDNALTILYLARVLNNDAHAQVNSINLQNSATYSYNTATVPATTTADTYLMNLRQPTLTVAKTATQEFGDSIVVAGEDITYTVTISNNGTAPAYDLVLRDTLPFGMRIATPTTVSIERPVATPLATFAPTYDSNTGIAEWNFDRGVADAYTIQPGQVLRIVYTAEVDTTVGAAVTLNNSAQAQFYYSFDDEAVPTTAASTDREVYGPSAAAVYTLTTPAPSPLGKQAPAYAFASIGEPFTYRITVPAAPVATALYDVRILDNLDALAPNVDLVFVGVQRISGTWTGTPVNTGTDSDLVIEDTVTGIDIPAGEQIVIDLTVQLRNTFDNVAGDVFQNVASYTYNSVNNDIASQGIGGGAAAANMTTVEPLTMLLDKTAPATIQYGVPGTFTIDVQNTGTGPAYDLTIVDHLPDPVPGGMCGTVPDNFTAVTRDATNVLQQTLTAGVDFTTTLTPSTALGTDPTCTLTLTMQSAAAVMQSNWHLVVNYDAHLDIDNLNGDPLLNYAAATQWFSADTPAGVRVNEIREYTQTFDAIDPGTPSIADHQDYANTTVAAPELEISKAVFNVATNNYAITAEPEESLRYEISIRNIGPVAAVDFSLSDEIDRLNPAPGFFVASSISNLTVTEPDATNTVNVNLTGGTNATGLIDISDLDLTAAGGGGDVLTISFEATIRDVIDSGNVIRNQAQVTLAGFSTLLSDDPAAPGIADPTRTIIGSHPLFQTEKVSDDITGDPLVLDRGDVLVYTLTIKNVGAEDAGTTILHDQIPANTTYVSNTTTLNGVAINDPATGISPLQDGMLIHAPENTSPGFMRANANPADTNNIATVTFNVTVNDNVVTGGVISNQAYVSGLGVGSGGFAEQLSDDPTTEIVGDPTRDIVGSAAILDAQKTVVQITDPDLDELVDVGETLHYTITLHNAGLIPATGVVLTDTLPANTTYVANTLLMNGLPVGQPDGGVLPLAAGVDVSSADLPPPASGAGTISAGETATLTFDVLVAVGTADGTVISNQGLITSNEYPDEQTDADGNDINGDQPTLITVGDAQQLTITKNVFVVGGGTAQPGGQLEYLITVTNNGNVPIDLRNLIPDPLSPPNAPVFIPNPVYEVLKVVDDIDIPGLITYLPGSARLNGVVDPYFVFDAPRLIVSFDESKRAQSNFYQFNPGDSFTVRYLVTIDNNAVQGDAIVNIAAVDWGTEEFTPVNAATIIRCSGGSQNVDACSTSSLAVGGAPGVATMSGKAWHDSNFDLDDQTTERTLEGWEVQIYFGNGDVNPGDYLDSVLTDVNGNFSISGLIPNASDTKLYALRFLGPGAATDTASLGNADSIYTDGPQQITFFDVANSSHTVDMNLPIQPNGVVYNAVTRNGVVGAVLQLTNEAGVTVPASCFNDSAQQNQRTLVDGYYKFELNFSDALCPTADDYTIHVFPPTGYVDYDNNPLTDEVSRIIPPLFPLTDPGYNVQTCASDATGTTPQCEVQTSEFAPPTSEAPRTAPTNYYVKLNLVDFPADDQLYNNHLAVDPELDSALGITKTSALVNVIRSQLVPYIITVTNTLGAPIYDIDIIDDYPAGFKYVAGSARVYVNGVRITNGTEEPVSLVQGAQGRTLTWSNFTIFESDVITIKILLVVGAGVGDGEYVNLAHAENNRTEGNASGEASATVRVVPDPTFDCSDIIGKVFNDKNLNGYADAGEPGIAGARVVTAQGVQATTDEYGRYHFTCAVIPNQNRGSNFIVKLDERSLPTGYRVTSENPRTQRATRGKMLKYNFGAAIHHVVRLDMMDAVFASGTTAIRLQWLSRLDMLMSELAKENSILRLSYLAENEDKSLVNERLDTVRAIIEKRWNDLNCCYKLMIETEVFWRKGGPVDKEPLE